MEWQKGSIVLATAGRDAGLYFVVTGADEKTVWLANGKCRSLAKPKRKNKKHVQQTHAVFTGQRWTDKQLRTWLNEFATTQ
jgi:ribosomal protein L14E/L6E/L27E